MIGLSRTAAAWGRCADSHVFAVGVALESLRRVGDGTARAAIAADAMRAGRSVTLAIKLFEEMKDEGLAAGVAIATIQGAVVELLHSKSGDGSLVNAPMLSGVLVHWAKYEDDATVSDWVKEQADSDGGFASLAAAHVHLSWSSDTGRTAEASPEVFDRLYDGETLWPSNGQRQSSPLAPRACLTRRFAV